MLDGRALRFAWWMVHVVHPDITYSVTMKSSTLILVHHSFDPVRVKSLFPTSRWIFFSRDMERKKSWEAAFGVARKIAYKPQLTRISYSLRDDFVDWATQVGKGNWDNWLWWLTRLASRSNAISPLYLYVCYIEVLKEIVRDQGTSIVVVVESWELLETVRLNLSHAANIAVPFPVMCMISRFKNALTEVAKFCYQWGRYLLNSSYYWIAARITKMKFPPKREIIYDRDHVVIHTCIDDACMKDDGQFVDRYYDGLATHLTTKGKKVSTLIWLYNVKRRSRLQALRWFRSHADSFLVPEDYYGPVDFVKSALMVIRSGYLTVNHDLRFNGADYSPILRNEQSLQRRFVGAAYFVNQKAMFRKWKELGIHVESYIDTWELKSCEVPALVAIKEYFPDCTRVAYQSVALVPRLMFANYKTTPEEFRASPHADLLIANGEVSKSALIREGFPGAAVHLGPSLRHLYLNDKAGSAKESTNEHTVLICLPLMVFTSVELLEVCYAAFPIGRDSDRYVVKFHPMAQMDEIKSRLSFQWPSHFQIAEGSMAEWIDRSSCVIISESSTMVEALYKQRYTIVYGKETDIDIIALDVVDDIKGWSYVTSIEGLKASAEQSRSYRMDKSDDVLKGLFDFTMERLDPLLAGN